jgi:transcriptional regulator with XRE-family HTH domain
MTQKPMLTDQLRKAIDASGKSRYQIAKETGLDEATLSRFIHGKGGLSMEGLDAIGKSLGLRIVTDKPHKAKGD